MYTSLGNIVFSGLTAFESFSRRDTTAYAQHELVSGKPRLQPVANDLEELSITLKLRAEFCDPAFLIRQIKDAKDTFTVLPFLTGAGRYLGDYIISEMSEDHNVMFSDGAIIEATISFTLREYVTPDKLEQQQQTARKRAFAIDKTPVNTGLKTDTTIPRYATLTLSAINSKAKGIDTKVINYANNPSQQNSISKSILKDLDSLRATGEKLNTEIKELETKFNPADLMAASISFQNAVQGFKANPLDSFTNLKNGNLQLQGALLSLKKAATILTYNVISRRG